MRAVKFLHSRGHPYHKYGPVPNLVLAPGYAAFMAHWTLTGVFTSPSDSFR